MFRIAICSCLIGVFTLVNTLGAFEIKGWEIDGRVDVSEALISLDILESGKTIETLNMNGLKTDATIAVYKGICIKPGLILAGKDGQFSSFSIALGQYIPVTDSFSVLPSVGVTWSYLHTRIDFPDFLQFDLKEKFRSVSPFLALELSYKYGDWRVTGLYQYAWSHTHTTIRPLFSDKSHSEGPNYGLSVEYSVTKNWAVNVGAGYNITLSKEKHGLRGKGMKFGLAYYF